MMRKLAIVILFFILAGCVSTGTFHDCSDNMATYFECQSLNSGGGEED